MSCIVQVKSGKYTYLYESVSYRDEKGRPRCRRTIIGKLDNNHMPEYKKEYIEKLAAAGKETPPKSSYSLEEIRDSSIKEYGAHYLFRKIAEATGLLKILEDIFSSRYQKIFDLACYLAASGDPLMYCDDWLSKTEAFTSRLPSSEISELLQDIDQGKQEAFFAAWSAYRREREYLALDITSVSSYSKLISDVEYGYNRDGENLPQVNLCLLVGEESRLPVYRMLYQGSLKDVSTLKTSLKAAYSLGKERLRLVMDKGFFSKKNLETLLSGPEQSAFLLAVPFTSKIAKDAVNAYRDKVEDVNCAIPWDKQSIQGIAAATKIADKKAYVHVFYNMVKAAETKSCLRGYVKRLSAMAAENPENKDFKEEFDYYLRITPDKRTGKPRVSIKKDVVEAEYEHAGYLVIVSNHCRSPENAIYLYRTKDVVEKGFYRLKNELDLNRLRIHSDPAMRAKIFVSFISLILVCYIHKVMMEHKMYKDWTMREMIKNLEKLRVQYIAENRILYPLTKTQRKIYACFGLGTPV